MGSFEKSTNKLFEVFDKAKISDHAAIKNILLVLDETEDREYFIFSLVEQLHQKTNASFIFLLAVRGYLSQAKDANIHIETLPELITRIKKRFSGEKVLFDVALIPDEKETPFNRMRELILKRKIDLIVIPAPFTLFAPEEEPEIASLGTTIDQVITEFLLKRRIPIYLVLKAQKTPVKDIKVLIRSSIFQNDFLGWLITMIEDDAHLDVYYSSLVTEKELNRLKIFFNIIKDKLEEEDRKIVLQINQGPIYLKDFCSIIEKEPDSLIVFQAIKGIENDAKIIASSICVEKSNALIFPPTE
ncbi:MAG: hypothetical protein KAT16_03780 [Candidatus Heimdallarchaeota archaeon]|nr:hypothetical protein [Candidatus Heimdallarchaeota archaeon]